MRGGEDGELAAGAPIRVGGMIAMVAAQLGGSAGRWRSECCCWCACSNVCKCAAMGWYVQAEAWRHGIDRFARGPGAGVGVRAAAFLLFP